MSVEDGIPETGQATPQTHDWERDYKALQAEYTRSQQALKEQEGMWEDDEALAARLREAKPDWFVADEEEPEEPDYETEPAPTPPDPRIDWLASREATRQYHEDLTEVVGDRELVGKDAKGWIEARSRAIALAANKPWDKKSLKQATDEYFEFVEDVRGPVRKTAPTPPQPGKAGEQKYDPRDRNARRARMAAAIEAANQQ